MAVVTHGSVYFGYRKEEKDRGWAREGRGDEKGRRNFILLGVSVRTKKDTRFS